MDLAQIFPPDKIAGLIIQVITIVFLMGGGYVRLRDSITSLDSKVDKLDKKMNEIKFKTEYLQLYLVSKGCIPPPPPPSINQMGD